MLDPFAGTGSFMAHLIESDLIPDDKLGRKYRCEMHSNEILLLAYYIMTINIEYAYHERIGGEYVPFEGGVLTDTFQMTEEGDTLDTRVFTQNSERVVRQNQLPIRVIVGNPPYSVGQGSANDNNQNEKYPTLDSRIENTYVLHSSGTLLRNLYDSYIRAFRWAADRIGEQGVICFVSNAGWLRSAAMNGFRRCLAEEFDDIYVFDLRGNQRTQGEESRREGGKVFGSGSRTPVAITLLVRHSEKEHAGRIHYRDIGDYLSREDKLKIVAEAAISGKMEWAEIKPDKYGDWLDQRDDSFYDFAPICLGKSLKQPDGIFDISSTGIVTNRDAWVINFNQERLVENVRETIGFYNSELTRLSGLPGGVAGNSEDNDPKRISWTRGLRSRLKKEKALKFSVESLDRVFYRPFCREILYFDSGLIENCSKMNVLFPPNCSNVVIAIAGINAPYDFSALMYRGIVSLTPYGGNVGCFPLYWFEEEKAVGGLFGDEATGKYIRHDAITDQAFSVFRKAYPHAFPGRYKKDGGEELSKKDIFYYVYGILHSLEYRERFSANLKKELPRIPLAEDFAAFSSAGRRLADFHLNYEAVKPWGTIEEEGDSDNPGRVEKMRFGKCKKTEDNPKGIDRTVLHVAENLTLRGIPEEAYKYVVNGKSAIDWLIDRYQVRTDKASGIVNDPNEYSDDPRYIVDLVKRVVTVSMETLEIMSMLPPLQEKPQPADWPFEWRGSQN